MTRVVLASKSPTRAALLTAAGVGFEAVGGGVDEEAVKASMIADRATPRDIADALAELKAIKVSKKRPGLVIGADQTLDLDGVLLSKVETPGQAREQLQALRGKTHRLHSAVVVAQDGQAIWRDLVSPKLTMRPFSDAFLEDYLLRHPDALIGSVGCYQLESGGLQLFDQIDGDYFAILGLPMLGLLDLLRRHGALAL